MSAEAAVAAVAAEAHAAVSAEAAPRAYEPESVEEPREEARFESAPREFERERFEQPREESRIEPAPREFEAPQPVERMAEAEPAAEPKRPQQTEMFTPVDLSASGLELVETTHKSEAASDQPESPAPAPRRTRRERPAAVPAEAVEPLEQVETRRTEDSAAH